MRTHINMPFGVGKESKVNNQSANNDRCTKNGKSTAHFSELDFFYYEAILP